MRLPVPFAQTAMEQAELFEKRSEYPAGFRYVREFISGGQEQRLLNDLQRLEFKPFKFHGFLGKRRIVSFGWRYDFNGGGLQQTGGISPFLSPPPPRGGAFCQM